MTQVSSFERLAAIDVGAKIEKKGNLSYLSWAWAVDQLLRADPTASWEYRSFGDFPYLTLPDGTAMVFCTVTVNSQPRTMQLPVMDHRNKAIPNPDAFAINTAMQRCLVKAIALHGLGLYIYAGEDVPAGEQAQSSGLSEGELADYLAAAEVAETKDALATLWKVASKACKDHDDVGAYEKIKAAVTKRGAMLKVAA